MSKNFVSKEEEEYREWMASEPIWFDSDMITAVLIGVGVGLFIGFALFYSWADPVTAPLRYVTG